MNDNQQQRRAHPRTPCAIPIVIIRDKPRMLSSALMLNYSRGGVYFEISAPLEAGADIVIKSDDEVIFDSLPGEARQLRRGEVRWCRKITVSGSSRYGCGVQYLPKRQESD